MSAQMPRQLSEKHAIDYHRDGVICIRNCVSEADVELLRREIARTLDEKTSSYVNHTARNSGTRGAFEMAFKIWENNDTLANFACGSHLPAVAAALMESSKINLLFDQCFVKQPQTDDPTPWHNDQPFWPIKGDQVITLWIALDYLTRESSALEFVRASHRWNRWIQPMNFSGENKFSINPKFEQGIDIEGNRDEYDIISWDLAPGDVLAFHGMNLHGAPANTTKNVLRRAYAIRYTGADVVYDPHLGSTATLLQDELFEGSPLDSSHFPVVWQNFEPG
jgi:ectoine hydroxylase-related dioxygenase (phytanoyl-CoA dioxygenase family)